MPNLLLPDILGSVNQGYDRGQSQQFNRLAGQAIADPDNASSSLGLAAAIDPTKALQVQTNLQSTQDAHQKKLAGAANYVLNAYQTGNPKQVEGAYQAVRPYLNELGKKLGQGEASPNFTEDMLPHLYQIVGQAGGDTALNGQLPSGYRELDLQAKAAGYKPGTPEYQNAMRVGLGTVGRASNAGIGFQKLTGADGRERIARQNPRTGAVEVYDETTGDFTPLGGAPGAAAPALGQPSGGGSLTPGMAPNDPMTPYIAQANQAIKNGTPPDQVEAWLGQRKAEVDAKARSANPGLGVSRAPEDTAGAVQDAKNASDLSYLPRTEGIKADIAVDEAGRKTTAETNAKATAERNAANAQKGQDARKTLSDLDEVDRLLPQATNGDLNETVDSAAAKFGHSTDTAKASAALDILAGRLTSSVPRMQGPQSDKDVALYQQQAGNVGNRSLPIATRQFAAKELRRLQLKYLDNPEGNGAQVAPQSSAGIQSAPSPAQHAPVDDLLSKYGVH